MTQQILDAFAALYQGNSMPMSEAISTFGQEEVEVVLSDSGIDLSKYWPPAEAPAPTSGTATDPTRGATMHRGDHSTSGLDVLDRYSQGAPAPQGMSKAEFVSDPSSAGYDPTHRLYDPLLDPTSAAYQAGQAPKRSNAGLWGLALLVGALVWGM